MNDALAGQGPVEPTVRPTAWIWRDADGQMRSSGWDDVRPTEKSIPIYSAQALKTAVAAERDCRTCKHWTPHHLSDVMHCSAAIRCVAGSSYRRQGVVQLWEAVPVDAGF